MITYKNHNWTQNNYKRLALNQLFSKFLAHGPTFYKKYPMDHFAMLTKTANTRT